MARNTANSIMALKPLTHRVDVAVLVNGVDRTDFIKIKKDYKKWLTNKRKCDTIVSEREVMKMTDKEILEKVQEFFEMEYTDLLRLMDRKPGWFNPQEGVTYAIQRCLGVAQFVQLLGVKYEDLNCYEEIRGRLMDLVRGEK